ncbi:hypothetical protein ASE41_21375 [Streptomyces sp. Root264]|nr:hypothetical protein ASE41_21375 [Streptomyces sp. Root264]
MKVNTAPPSRIAVPATRPSAFRAPWSPEPVSARPPLADVDPPEDDEPPPDAPLACSAVSSVRETAVLSGVQVVVVPMASTVRTPGESVDSPVAPGL